MHSGDASPTRPAPQAWSLAGAGVGMLSLLTLAAWWLAGVHNALAQGDASALISGQLLTAAWAVRLVWLPLLVLPAAAAAGPGAALAAAVGVLAPAWPLTALAWSASRRSVGDWLMPEASLIALACALAWGAAALGRTGRRHPGELAAWVPAAALLLAAAAWALARHGWPGSP